MSYKSWKYAQQNDYLPASSIREVRERVPAMPVPRFLRFKAYLNVHGFEVEEQPKYKSYKIRRKGENSFYSVPYWQVNQPTENVLALLTMKFGYMFPHTPRDSYRCPDCGCNTDAQVEKGAIEGTTRCQDCYDMSQGD